MDSGAYKCFRGCTPTQIREELGVGKERAIATPPSNPPPRKVLITLKNVQDATQKLLTQSTHALAWLDARGINQEMIRYYQLGIVRAKVGDSTKANKSTHLPAISIPIPTKDGTHYLSKKRVRPWASDDEQPDGYKRWSQYGIPAMTYITHAPERPTQTWLCEGEWDAIMMGWRVKHDPDLSQRVSVACFTCGAGNVPHSSEWERLQWPILVWYDRDDAGQKGARKLQQQMKSICRICDVPVPRDRPAPSGWDVSDAINEGLFGEFPPAATNTKEWKSPNPLRKRMITNDELLARAPDYTDWLVDDIITADELYMLAASPRAGKSLMAFTLAYATATGSKFLGHPCAQGAVIYISCEDSEAKTKERQMKQGWGAGLPIYWLDNFVLGELDHLKELIEEVGARLVVFDTFAQIRDDSYSEGAAEMNNVLKPLQQMCKALRCAALLVHHTKKVTLDNAGTINVFDTIRGSSAIRGACRGVLIIAAEERSYRLFVENGWGKLDLQILLDANTLNWKLVGNWVGPTVDLSQKDRVLAYLSKVGSASIDQIAESTNLPRRSLYEVLKRLQSDDLIQKQGNRTSAIYVKTAIQQIQQLNSLLNSSNVDREKDISSIQQLSTRGGDPKKVINSAKSDPNTSDLGSLLNNNPDPAQVGKLLNRKPESISDKVYSYSTAIQHDSTSVCTIFENPCEAKDLAVESNSTKNAKSDQFGPNSTVIGKNQSLLGKGDPNTDECTNKNVDWMRCDSDHKPPLEATVRIVEGDHQGTLCTVERLHAVQVGLKIIKDGRNILASLNEVEALLNTDEFICINGRPYKVVEIGETVLTVVKGDRGQQMFEYNLETKALVELKSDTQE